MDKYTKAIMTLIKNVFENVVGVRDYQTESEARTYYLKNLDDNLYEPIDEAAKKAYGEGTGNENRGRGCGQNLGLIMQQSQDDVYTQSDSAGPAIS